MSEDSAAFQSTAASLKQHSFEVLRRAIMAPGQVDQAVERKDDAQIEAIPKNLPKGVVLGPDGKP